MTKCEERAKRISYRRELDSLHGINYCNRKEKRDNKYRPLMDSDRNWNNKILIGII